MLTILKYIHFNSRLYSQLQDHVSKYFLTPVGPVRIPFRPTSQKRRSYIP